MTMKTMLVSVAVAAAATLSAGAANAATYVIPVNNNGSTTVTISPGSGPFIDTFTFFFSNPGKVTLSLTSTDDPRVANDNVNFNATRVKFNGMIVPILSRGAYELRAFFNKPVNAGTSTLVVQGSAQSLGQYTGTLVYGIPETAVWAMMILGMGATGAALRVRRRKVSFTS